MNSTTLATTTQALSTLLDSRVVFEVSPQVVIANLVLVFVLSLVIALVYKYTHRGLSYSQTFSMTLVIAGIVISAIMMVIGTSIARAFGAFGAFSLIRFRTAIKDSKDMGYIFLVLAVGMAVGTGNYLIAVTLTIFVLLVIIILTKLNFGSMRKYDYILTFNFDTKTSNENVYKDIFDKFLKSNNVLYIKARHEGHVLILSFSVKFISEKNTGEFVSILEKAQGVSDVSLIVAKNDVEY